MSVLADLLSVGIKCMHYNQAAFPPLFKAAFLWYSTGWSQTFHDEPGLKLMEICLPDCLQNAQIKNKRHTQFYFAFLMS